MKNRCAKFHALNSKVDNLVTKMLLEKFNSQYIYFGVNFIIHHMKDNYSLISL